MKHTIASLVTAFLIMTALATPSASKGEKDRNDKRSGKTETEVINQVYQVGKNARLSLSNLNGEATVTGWDKNTIEVTATKHAGSQERLDDATVTFDLKNDHLRIEVDYEFEDDTYDYHDGDLVGVEFEIRVPRGIDVGRVELVNGGLEFTDLTGSVDASSVNGNVTAKNLSGETRLSTVNGDVSLSSVRGHDDIELSSVNGSVTLYLPHNVNAKLTANTVHGDIRGNLGNGVTHAGSSVDAVLGTGGARIELGTVNGDIRIRRADSDARDDSDDDSD